MTAVRRRRFLLGLIALPTASRVHGNASGLQVVVWKSPSCGCCTGWIEHLQRNGFAVKVHDTGNVAARARLKIPSKLGSCHTAEVAGYAVEGHVPAEDIRRLLDERPRAIGLAVPGMPIGSPGMEIGDQRDPYDVLLVELGGTTRVFRSYRGAAPTSRG